MIISKRNLFQGAMFRFQFHEKRWEGNCLILQTSTVQLSSFRVISLTHANQRLVKEKMVTFEETTRCFLVTVICMYKYQIYMP